MGTAALGCPAARQDRAAALWLRGSLLLYPLVLTRRQYLNYSHRVREKLGREDRCRTVISGMEPRRIAVVMLLPRVQKSIYVERSKYCMENFLSIWRNGWRSASALR